jgi:hypothetical protein
MRKVTRALVIGASTATLFVAGTFVAAAAPVEAQAVSGDYRVAGVYIRSCPSTSCTARGLGYPGQDARIDCFRQGTSVSGNDLWLHHRNVRTGVLGYSADFYMRHGTLNVPRC